MARLGKAWPGWAWRGWATAAMELGGAGEGPALHMVAKSDAFAAAGVDLAAALAASANDPGDEAIRLLLPLARVDHRRRLPASSSADRGRPVTSRSTRSRATCGAPPCADPGGAALELCAAGAKR